MADDLQVVLLGTGSPIPDPNRAGPATLVRANGVDLLVDCGRGVLMRLAGAGVLPMMLGGLLITHMHSDHVTDLNDVITTRWAMSFAPNPLTVVGPPGTARLIDDTMDMLEHDFGYRIAHHDDLEHPPDNHVTEVVDGEVDVFPGVRVIAAPTDHAPVAPTIGLRFEVGSKVPMLQTAMGRAYLAGIAPDDREALVSRFLQRYADNPGTVQDAVATAREEYERSGFCSSSGNWFEEVNGIAVPIPGTPFADVLVLNCGAPAVLMPKERMISEVGPRLVTAAEEIGRMFTAAENAKTA